MNPAQGLDHAISAASLVLAVLAAIYTLWLGEVSKVLAIKPDVDIENRKPQKRAVTCALLTKGVPLFLASAAAVGIILPRAGGIASEAFTHHGAWTFSDVKAFFLLTAVLLGVVCVIAAGQAILLLNKRLKLNR